MRLVGRLLQCPHQYCRIGRRLFFLAFEPDAQAIGIGIGQPPHDQWVFGRSFVQPDQAFAVVDHVLEEEGANELVGTVELDALQVKKV